MRTIKFESEAALVAEFCANVERLNGLKNSWTVRKWTAYHETGGFDLVLVDDLGVQIGIEAKLSLNNLVLAQALPCYSGDYPGPDYRAVLVPDNGVQTSLEPIARACGLTVIRQRKGGSFQPSLPDEDGSRWALTHWFPRLPIARLALPEYVPDVIGGKASPVALTHWKIKAIKLMIILDRRGYVTRQDMKFLDLSPSRWTAWDGFLKPTETGYVRSRRTPDFKAQHPKNYRQIAEDFDKWCPEDCKGLGRPRRKLVR